MAVTGIRLEHFTAFDELNLRPSRGVNVFVGANGTGKTHLLKVAYAACDAARQEMRFADKLARVFLPAEGRIGRLAKRRRGVTSAVVEVRVGKSSVRTEFSSRPRSPSGAPRRRGKYALSKRSL